MTTSKKLLCTIAIFIAIILTITCVGIYSSYNNLTVNEYTVQSAKMSGSLNFVVIADLHDHSFGKDNQKLVDRVLTQKPDAVLMVGDFINKDSSDYEEFMALVEQLSERVPVYFSWGNHELGYVEVHAEADLITFEKQLTEAGAVVLDEQYQDVEIAGQIIRIGGMYDYAFALDSTNSCSPDTMDPEVYQFLTEFQEQDDIFKLMLAHRPDSFVLGKASQTWDIDLVVSGHMHGGQVVLPFLGGVVGGDQGWFPEYVHGLYQKDKINIFITSGLGSSKKALPRFNNPPEIAVLHIMPETE